VIKLHCRVLLLTGICLLLSSCTGASSAFAANPASGTLPADYEVLLIGNSHSSNYDLPALIVELIETGLPGKTATASDIPHWNFLAERLTDGNSVNVLQSKPWTHVILQAQKYSSSGRYTYPTDAAIEWIKLVRQQNAMPIMFPEWARRNNDEEGTRIHDLHLQIVAIEPACVAPVGLAWEQAKTSSPKLRLHAADGNHSNIKGALLTAFVFYEIISGQLASGLPYVQSIKVNADIQSELRNIASQTLRDHPACK
jgi:hypothetical protein